MQGDSSSTGHGASSPRSGDRSTAHEVWRTGTSQQLHAACLSAAHHEPFRGESAYTTVEYEAVRRAVAMFVVNCKADDLPPERALMQLKEVVNDSLRVVGREPHEEALRAIIFEAFLGTYFDYAPSADGDGA